MNRLRIQWLDRTDEVFGNFDALFYIFSSLKSDKGIEWMDICNYDEQLCAWKNIENSEERFREEWEADER